MRAVTEKGRGKKNNKKRKLQWRSLRTGAEKQEYELKILVSVVLCALIWFVFVCACLALVLHHMLLFSNLTQLSCPPQESLCPAQLILEDEGLSRIAHTVQALLELPPSGPRRASLQTPAPYTNSS